MGAGRVTGVLATAALGIVLGWVAFALAGLVLPATTALVIGAALGGVAVTLFRDTVPIAGAMALLAPFGVMLPALALRHAWVTLGLPAPGFATWEIALFALLYAAFLATAFGVIPVDLYRFGYAPIPVAILTLAACGWGIATGNPVVPLVAVAGQLGWALGWGSSNWFDYVTHFLLLPVALTVLILRIF